MKRRGLQLSRRQRLTLYSAGLLLLISGIVWQCLHTADENGHATEAMRRMTPLLMAVHGFSALGFVILFGMILPIHVRHSWHARKNRGNGAFFLSIVSLLILSGYALYYISDDKIRAFNSAFHFWLGTATPVLLIWHIRSGRKATADV